MKPIGLSSIPAVDEVLRCETGALAIARFGRSAATAGIRRHLALLRAQAVVSEMAIPSATDVGVQVLQALVAEEAPSVRPVFNLTGVVLHTNLGRAVLAEEAISAAAQAMRSPAALEFDLESGGRGERDDHIRPLLCELTGAEDAIAVNNNASAALLVLATLAFGKETIVSRGELIEIGGSFRIPTIMESAGTILREVGTTNRTHPQDYSNAIGSQTALLMKVHMSNYAIQGFTAEVASRELAGIAKGTGLPFIDDLGSGTLVDLSRYGLRRERTVQDALRDGADLVTFSGDKLLGGPQAGFIVGRRDLVRRCAKHPLKRAMRLDKIRLAALDATLRLYRDPDTLCERLPTMRHLTRTQAEIAAMARGLVEAFASWIGPGWQVEVADCTSRIGSGALPLEGVPSAGFTLRPERGDGNALGDVAARLRRLPIPVIGHIADGALVLDLRCLDDPELLRRNLEGA
jgi:L-seryl-tRNA(Ser) seleniumtransferase